MSNDKESKAKKQRLDQLLVTRGLVADAKTALALIMAGQVVVDDQRRAHPGEMISRSASIRIKKAKGPFVSRAGEKLAGLVADAKLNDLFQGAAVLDVGASTGGFSDYALQNGALKANCVDVGTNQLAWNLRQDERVVVFEQRDIRSLKFDELGCFEVVMVDVSFISLTTILDSLVALAKESFQACGKAVTLLLLVKPQFELPKELVPAGGVIADMAMEQQALDRVTVAVNASGLSYLETFPARIKGRSGNQEYFVIGRYQQ